MQYTPTILEIIDISHDRFLSGRVDFNGDFNGGRKHTSFVKKEVSFRKIIEKEVSFSNSQVKI